MCVHPQNKLRYAYILREGLCVRKNIFFVFFFCGLRYLGSTISIINEVPKCGFQSRGFIFQNDFKLKKGHFIYSVGI